MKMILLPQQTVTDITFISFYEVILNEYSVSNRVKTWTDLSYVMVVNRLIDLCRYMSTKVLGSTNAYRQIQ